MTRKRTRESLAHVLCEPCPTCAGRGEIKTAQTVCYDILREILREARQFDAREYRIAAAQSVIDLFSTRSPAASPAHRLHRQAGLAAGRNQLSAGAVRYYFVVSWKGVVREGREVKARDLSGFFRDSSRPSQMNNFMQTSQPTYWPAACAALAAADPVMAALIAHYPTPFSPIAAIRSRPWHAPSSASRFQSKRPPACGRVSPTMRKPSAPSTSPRCNWTRSPPAGCRAARPNTCAISPGISSMAGVEPARWKKMDDEAVIAELTDVRVSAAGLPRCF